MLRVGYVLLGLTGAVKDYGHGAHTDFQRAAELGDGDGNVMLGNMAAGGIGEPRDFARAADFYERAAAIGNMNAKASLMPLLMAGAGRSSARSRQGRRIWPGSVERRLAGGARAS